MALSAAELDVLIRDLTRGYAELSREYSEIADEERKEEIADTIGVLDCELASLGRVRGAAFDHCRRYHPQSAIARTVGDMTLGGSKHS